MTASSNPTRTTTRETNTTCRVKRIRWIRTCPQKERQREISREETTRAIRSTAALSLAHHREVHIRSLARMVALMGIITTIIITHTVTHTHTLTRTRIHTRTPGILTKTTTRPHTNHQHPLPSPHHTPAALGPGHHGPARPTWVLSAAHR